MMRMRNLTWALVAAWGATAGLAQRETSVDESQIRVSDDRAREQSPDQVSEMVNRMKTSLVDAIRTAENAAHGKAVAAQCRTGGTRGKGAESSTERYECVITICTADKKLVEVTVDNQNNTVVAQRDLPRWLLNTSAHGDDAIQSESRTERVDRNRGDGDADRLTRGTSGAYMGGEARWFAPAKRTQKGSDLIGKSVKNSAGEALGKVENLVIDTGNGRILYAVLSFGGMLGIGDKNFAIPWGSFELPADAKTLVLGVDKDQLKNAEGFDKAHWPNVADERWATTTNKYYGQPPYWSRGSNDVRTAGDIEDRPANKNNEPSPRERWFRPATGWQKANDLIGKNVRNLQNEKLGDVSDLVIDPDTGRVLYGIVSYNSKYIAVPWGAFSLSSGFEHFVLDITSQRMKDAASFARESWPNLSDATWTNQTYSYFNQPPYWGDGARP